MIVDFLRAGRQQPELRDRFTILVMMGATTKERCLRSPVGIESGSDCDCFLSQLSKVLKIIFISKPKGRKGWNVTGEGLSVRTP